MEAFYIFYAGLVATILLSLGIAAILGKRRPKDVHAGGEFKKVETPSEAAEVKPKEPVAV